MAEPTYNFNPGPAALPLPVLEMARDEFLDYRGTGLSILETSHRSKDFTRIVDDANDLIRELYDISSEYHILWLQGGASTQFFMVPANIMQENKPADYVNTGAWSKKAIKEARFYGKVKIAASSEDKEFSYIPKNIQFNGKASYAHITSNNTIYGTQWSSHPDTEDIPLVCDMSSDFLSRRIDISRFGVIYAGAQKNLGPAGVTIVIIRDDLVKRSQKNLPTMIKYETYSEKNSLYNTPPCFSIYICKLNLEYMKSTGGIEGIEKRNKEKSEMIYKIIDNSDGFYRPHAEKESRSRMNITFNLQNKKMEDKCVEEGRQRRIVGIKGHRSVGGLRASLYNSVTIEDCRSLSEFLIQFNKKHSSC